MEDKAHHGHKWMPVMYASYYGILIDIARTHGYALAIHGSVTRDLDLIAIPWVENCRPVEDLLRAICSTLGSAVRPDGTPAYDTVKEQPHGRMSYAIVTNGGGYIDLSVMTPISQFWEK